MDIGEKCAALRRLNNLSQRALAMRIRQLGPYPKLSAQSVQALEATRGRRVAWIAELAQAFGMTVEQLNAWNGEPIPPVSTPATASAHSPVAAGAAREYVHIAVLTVGGDINRGNEAVKGMDIAEWWAQQNLPRPFDRVRLMTNRGDALRGSIDDGDLVFVDTQRASWDGPGIYVVVIGGQPQPRQLHQRMGGDLVLGCTNPAYPPEIIPASEIGQLPISGRVVVSLGVRRW